MVVQQKRKHFIIQVFKSFQSLSRTGGFTLKSLRANWCTSLCLISICREFYASLFTQHLNANALGSYCARLLLQFREAPREFENLQSLVIEAVKRFNAAHVQLRAPGCSSQHATREQFFPFEDQWQKEFYRIAFGFGILVSPEYRIHRRGSINHGQ